MCKLNLRFNSTVSGGKKNWIPPDHNSVSGLNQEGRNYCLLITQYPIHSQRTTKRLNCPAVFIVKAWRGTQPAGASTWMVHLNGRRSSKVNRWVKRDARTSGERSLQISSPSSHFIQMRSGTAKPLSQWGDSLLIEISPLWAKSNSGKYIAPACVR